MPATGSALPLADDRRELFVHDRCCARAVGSSSDGHPHHWRGCLESRGCVHRVTGREPFTRARIDVETDERLPGVHPDPYLDAEVGRSDVLDNPERCSHSTLGIVLVREGHPEHADDRVPDELLDDPAVGLDPARQICW